MRPLATPVALVVMVAVAGSACTTMTPGIAYPVRATVTVVSTVTETPRLPTRRVFQADSVERGVTGVLRDDYKISGVETVECPQDQPVVVGTSFVCVVQLDGRTKEVTVTVKSGDGEYEVGQPR